MTRPAPFRQSDIQRGRRWVVIDEARRLAPYITPYEEYGRRSFRWRWLARLHVIPLAYRKIGGEAWFIRSRLEEA